MLKKHLKFYMCSAVILIYITSIINLRVHYQSISPLNARVCHTGKYFIFVDCEESKLYLFQNGELIKTYKCAGGKPTTPSPIGTWTIISKGHWTGGFGGYWMGFNVPWGKFGIHGNNDPNRNIGWASSHGCIRMRNEEVKELYNMIPVGTKVKIEDGPFGEFGKGFRIISTGKYGSDIKRIQIELKKRGYYKGNPHGYFDKGTLYAVNKFQKDNKMKVQDKINFTFYEKLGLFEFE